jgi:flagellar basal body-associated protein FliL
MRWLMIVLLVSVVGLLAAALGMARHIWMQRSQERRERGTKAEQEVEITEKAESEVEP